MRYTSFKYEYLFKSPVLIVMVIHLLSLLKLLYDKVEIDNTLELILKYICDFVRNDFYRLSKA